MTSSFIVNLKGPAHTGAPSPLKNASPCFDRSGLFGKDSLSTSTTASARRAGEIRGAKTATVSAVGLRRTTSLNDTATSVGAPGPLVRASASQPNLRDSMCISSSVCSSRINRGEPARCSTTRTRSHRGPDSERRCYPATEREPVTEDEQAEASGGERASEGEFQFRSSGLSKLSLFLRELARQDCWAGLLEPFQGAGNLSPGNYSFQDWKMRTHGSSNSVIPPNLPSSGYDSHLSTAPYNPSSEREQEVQEQPSMSVSTANASESSNLLSAYSPDSNLLSSSATTAWRNSQGSEDVGASVNGSVRVNGSGPHGSSERVWIHDKPQAELCHKSATCVTAEDIGSCEDLAVWLEERIGSAVVSQWGSTAATKRVANLWCELVEGEISLEDSRPPKRTAHVASVKIRNEQGHVLVEAYQQMADGRVRPRNRPLSEKMRPGEHVEEACLRGIFEELGCQMGARERVVMVPESYRREEEERESFSYPGLPTRYVIHTMVAHVDQLPSTEFSTEEDESGHGQAASSLSNGGVNRSSSGSAPVGVKRHFWKWVPESQLAEICRR